MKQIHFNSMMMQALLDGRKTQTRRLINPQPIDNTEVDGNIYEGNHKGYVKNNSAHDWKRQFIYQFCEYTVGERLLAVESGEWSGITDKLILITDIQIQRVQEIDHENARAEGVWAMPHRCEYSGFQDSFRDSFLHLWNRIYGAKGFPWQKNPYCYAYKFEVLP
jgi:hypothetical protein